MLQFRLKKKLVIKKGNSGLDRHMKEIACNTNKIRSDNNSVTDRSVDFQIVGLRKKMNNLGRLIETIRGVGYRFKSKDF